MLICLQKMARSKKAAKKIDISKAPKKVYKGAGKSLPIPKKKITVRGLAKG